MAWLQPFRWSILKLPPPTVYGFNSGHIDHRRRLTAPIQNFLHAETESDRHSNQTFISKSLTLHAHASWDKLVPDLCRNLSPNASMCEKVCVGVLCPLSFVFGAFVSREMPVICGAAGGGPTASACQPGLDAHTHTLQINTLKYTHIHTFSIFCDHNLRGRSAS